MASAPETVVVELARAGDLTAFRELVRRREQSIRGLLRRLSRNAAQADELSQEVFIQAWRGIKRLQTNAAFWSWLRQIAVRTWMHALRDEQQRAIAHSAVGSDAIAEVSSCDEDCLDLDAALAELEPPVRLCVVLSYQVEMSHSEIADVTGLPLGTVKSHINRGAKTLREILESYRSAR
ncbi:MAG TPA: sigma-70 family RNA polymerase sigma factor [Steroidobacteraceae bacterium]|nr:sigma-70 family RNA polymerase sigma factor [Steroidobacteraceae bacterium]